MHQALYRKWRPRTFDEVCGQEHITSILKYEGMEGAFCHAYLFCGSRGTGKTTCAKILAKAVNCESLVNGSPCGKCAACRSIDAGTATDVLEMDAASNNSVEDIRNIRDEVVYPPSLLKYRVYIIDEVHMLSGSAFNALLKTLEEPPPYVVFILATTEMHKLPATIISRCQRFEFRRIATPVLRDRLTHIAQEEGIALTPDAALLLGRLAQGGMRDAISLMELCAGARQTIDVPLVNQTVGLTGRDAIVRAVEAIYRKDYDALYAQVHEVVQSAKDICVFWQDLIAFYRDMLVIKTTPRFTDYLDLSDDESKQLQRVAGLFPKETLLFHQKLLDGALVAMQSANALKRVVAEMTLVRMCDEALNTGSEALLSRIARIEEQMMSGAYRSQTPPVADDMAEPAEPTESAEPAEPSEQEAAAPEQPAAEPLPQATGRGAASHEKATQAQPSAVSDTTGKRVLRPLRVWAEVVERLTAQDPMAASFVRGARAFEDGQGRVILRFENDFSLIMLDRGDTKDMLRGALSVCLQREVRESALVCERMPETPTGCAIDEIIEALDEV